MTQRSLTAFLLRQLNTSATEVTSARAAKGNNSRLGETNLIYLYIYIYIYIYIINGESTHEINK
jgi:hypothetical protein